MAVVLEALALMMTMSRSSSDGSTDREHADEETLEPNHRTTTNSGINPKGVMSRVLVEERVVHGEGGGEEKLRKSQQRGNK